MAVGVTFPRGFRAAGVRAGIKASGRPDVALVVADAPAQRGRALHAQRWRPARPCARAARRSSGSAGLARAIVVSSGNANAATGAQGRADAERMTALAGELVGAAAARGAGRLDGRDRRAAAHGARRGRHPRRPPARSRPTAAPPRRRPSAPRTRRPKVAQRTLELAGGEVRLGAMAKGAAMIRPDLGTMIAVVTTDADVPAGLLRELLVDAAARELQPHHRRRQRVDVRQPRSRSRAAPPA